MGNCTLSAFKVRKNCRKLVLGTVMMIPKGCWILQYATSPRPGMAGELVVYVQKLYGYL